MRPRMTSLRVESGKSESAAIALTETVAAYANNTKMTSQLGWTAISTPAMLPIRQLERTIIAVRLSFGLRRAFARHELFEPVERRSGTRLQCRHARAQVVVQRRALRPQSLGDIIG